MSTDTQPRHAALVRNDMGGLEPRLFDNAGDAARASAARKDGGTPESMPDSSRYIEVTGTARIEPLVCNATVARQILGGIGVTSLWQLEKRGVIRRLPDFPRSMYSVAHLRDAVARQLKK